MFNPSREEVRRFFCEAWQKRVAGNVLTPLEAIAVDWIDQHPEYQSLLTDTEGALARDYTPEGGQTNPRIYTNGSDKVPGGEGSERDFDNFDIQRKDI